MPIISLQEMMLVVSAAVVIIAYHAHQYTKVRRDPLTAAVDITNHARQMWVKGVIRDRRDIMAVQTLRNQVMAATFLASTAILISLGLFRAAFRPGCVQRYLACAQSARNQDRNIVDVQTDAAGQPGFSFSFISPGS